jgi:hypothetical protein
LAISTPSIKKVVALMTMNGNAFEIFIEKFLVPQLWSGAVVVMDNLSAHKRGSIVPMIEAVGASVLNLSSYSPDFNPYAFGGAKPYELWCPQLKSFLRSFAPTTTEIVDKLISVALDLINPQHLKN